MLGKDKEVQAVAVYAEFSRPGATTQVIITPEGYTNGGALVPATIIRRTVTETTPKKQWKFTRLGNTALRVESDEDKAPYADDRMKYAGTLFDQLLAGSWTLVKQPVLIEASKKDYDDILVTKTPTKMIYRISQSRAALDFPDNLIQTVS